MWTCTASAWSPRNEQALPGSATAGSPPPPGGSRTAARTCRQVGSRGIDAGRLGDVGGHGPQRMVPSRWRSLLELEGCRHGSHLFRIESCDDPSAIAHNSAKTHIRVDVQQIAKAQMTPADEVRMAAASNVSETRPRATTSLPCTSPVASLRRPHRPGAMVRRSRSSSADSSRSLVSISFRERRSASVSPRPSTSDTSRTRWHATVLLTGRLPGSRRGRTSEFAPDSPPRLLARVTGTTRPFPASHAVR